MSISTPLSSPSPAPFQCVPDTHLTQEHLDVLYNEFNISISASLLTASVFSSLMNGVRQLYLSKLVQQQQQLDIQAKQYEHRISELTQNHVQELLQIGRERKDERAILLRCVEEAVGEAKSDAVEKPLPVLPADTTTLYVCGSTGPRRDMVGWTTSRQDDWSLRFDFEAFKFLEIGTVMVTIGESEEPKRMNVFLGNVDIPRSWTEKCHFFAFDSEQPGTVMISVGQAKDRDPERCILVRGDNADRLDGWEEKFVFWAPE